MVLPESVGAVRADKAALREASTARRAALSADERAAAAMTITSRLLEQIAEHAVTTVASYTSFGTEPATTELNVELIRRGVRLLVPVLLPDGDLDWADANGARLGPAAVATVDAVVVPGLAGDRGGGRLGRGGGSYDRALARVPAGVPRLLLLYDGDVVESVPAEEHDQRVTHLVSPSALVEVSG